MNYTYYNKLKSISIDNKKELNKYINLEISNINTKSENSYWGKTKAMKEYIKILRVVKLFNIFNNTKVINKYIDKKCSKFDKKIRALFIVNEYFVFPSFKSVYDRMRNDDNFICDLVYVPFSHSNKESDFDREFNDYIENGYKEIIHANNYKLHKASPDIVFYLKPYNNIPEQYCLEEVQRFVDKVIYIAYGLHSVDNDDIIKYEFQLPMQDNAWYSIAYSSYVMELAKKYSKQKGKNYLLIGHPRMDLMNEDYSDNEWYKEVKKRANGRKIFLYDPHHTINESYKWGTFKLYGLKILEYFKNNKDIFLLYRPHPLLKGSLEKEYQGNNSFFEKYNNLLNSENIMYDDYKDYMIAMHISDYLISDANSFVPEFVMYNKPVIYIRHPEEDLIKDSELKSMLYVANSEKEIMNYIDDLRNGKDKLKSIRNKKVKSHFNYDENKTVAEKLIDIIKKEYRG